ncbi:MAG TPA: hypothetical protein VJZ27_20855, partial [Aggregatilineales bacterium]|nr:hypothetical protein [Aggregatilineales bacterium]
TFEATIQNIAGNGAHLPQPDFAALARRCPPISSEIKPGRAALGTIFPETPLFTELLANTHDLNAPMTKIFQHFVLGHEQFARTYQCEPQFETESLLEKLDVPMLTVESIEKMRETKNVQPVIYTARPSLPPGFVSDWHGYSPEAEIAQRLLGLFDAPLVGYGRMEWIAQQKHVPVGDYVKPSPMQALAAIYSALLYDAPGWEESAFELLISDSPPPGDAFRVIVCEDSTGGIRGVREAVEILRERHGLDITFSAVGIAKAPENIAALEKVADYVAADVNTGLALALDW